ncbi:hypothetical protein BS47DRAFT_1336474 [Hydnum rufescens UP504]|uniref:GTP-binding protein TrmE N-terminal domain-containing protein n=1 Tax=Hydnum rufescens UP504 TaxID=1448309 RepID=A0A9P6B8L3_9AGAM|nr:hypothetical protein BS47DRAFT_1336474 [Hydnum rufescens UP504]
MVIHPETQEVLDDGIAVFFHAPNTHTSRNFLELHVHSGRAVTSAVLSALSHIPTLHLAEPERPDLRDRGRGYTRSGGCRDRCATQIGSQICHCNSHLSCCQISELTVEINIIELPTPER